MKLTPGCPEASPARRLPMRPAPTTAIPSCLRSIISLLGSDAGVAREAALLLELRSDVIAEVFRRAARLQLDAALDERLVSSASLTAFATARCRRTRMSRGVPAGATRPLK